MVQISHILYLSEKPDQNPFSGTENHVMKLCSSLAKRGIDVELIVLLWNDGPIIQRRLDEIRQEGVAVEVVCRESLPVINSRITRALACWLQLLRVLEYRRERVIHIHLDLIAVALTARLAGCHKLIVTIHNDEPGYSSFLWSIWLRLIDQWIVGYIGITNHVRNYYLKASGIDPSKMVTVYYGVDAPRESCSARAMWGVKNDGFLVGFIGRLTEQKNLHIFLNAMKKIPEVYAVVVGDGPLRNELEEIIRVEGINNVRLIGAIPDAATIIPSFDVFCLPSKWEGLGLVLVEAMLQGVPVIGSRSGAIPEILCNGTHGLLFETAMADELAECLRYAFTHPEQMKTFAMRAAQHARSNFSVDVMASQTLAVYQRVNLTNNYRGR